nr:MAG TPA: hypothetical protein [Caudoviricetes sp.]
MFIPDRSLTSITHKPLKRSEFEAAHSRRRNLKRLTAAHIILIIALFNPAVLLS